MARHLICIIHGVGKHDSNKRRERLDEMVKNKDLLLPRVGGDVDFEFRFTEWHRCHTRVMSLYFATSPSSVSLLSLPRRTIWSNARHSPARLCGPGFGALVRGERGQVCEREEEREREQERARERAR